MKEPDREIYVISDLHIGGDYPEKGAHSERGFRICTHVGDLVRFIQHISASHTTAGDVELVINGDFVDFLAEEHEDGFRPFLPDQKEAARCFDRITERDKPFFNELRAFVESGGRLTILLGNHDVELSLPAVRERLLDRVTGDRAGRVKFLYDGEAYVVGDAIIEHGNRYDGWNTVDHDGLRHLRSRQSRWQGVSEYLSEYRPSAGSRLVAEVMNPIKRTYPFVDLLKPERESVVPILLALEPGLRNKVIDLLRLHRQAVQHEPSAAAEPQYCGDISARDETSLAFVCDLAASGPPDDQALTEELIPLLGDEDAERFVAGLGAPVHGEDIASAGLSSILGLARLVLSNDEDKLEDRLPALLIALRAVQNDRSFDENEETCQAFLDAAKELAARGFRWIVFGHTHLAKCVRIDGGTTYLNTGTWADLIQLPSSIVQQDHDQSMTDLRRFVKDMVEKRFNEWIKPHLTFVYMELHDGSVVRGELEHFGLAE